MTSVASPPLPRDEFEVCEDFAYLNHAAVGVLPRRTRDALRTFIDRHASEGVLGVFPYDARMPEFRGMLARFIGARAGEIALLRNTGDGANVVANGIVWEPGDEIITNDNEFGANAYPWLRLRERGVSVRFIDTRRERMTPDVLRKAISDCTRLVTLSWVSFSDGFRHDLASLAEVAHAAKALIAVDVIQGLGAFPLDVERDNLDFAYGGGAKWLLALQGVSFLYVREALLDRMQLAMPGWRSVHDMWSFLDYDQSLAPDATRFEGGTPNFIGALSLSESISVLAAAGTTRIASHVLALTDHLTEGLQSLGAHLTSVRGEHCSSGIVTFSLPGRDPVALGKELQKDAIVTTYRPSGVRVAPHGYNTHDEIRHLLSAVQKQSVRSRSA
ncbi:MAG: aminotransferase class V-fold PLP-dependent enzyme [Candidatus Eremiobacteraeota bacterium]|nr:aminotransferase class V-fold PLP-dependent enzyme [Candidatus Eremiobacteraeota bacterium]